MHIHARCNVDRDAAAIANARGTETPSLIADLEFEICSGSAGRGKLMQRESNGCIYAACFYFLLAQMHQSKMYIGFTLK